MTKMPNDSTGMPAIVEPSSDTLAKYIEAHQELNRRMGTSPGPEFLMTLAVESADPMELIDAFTAAIVQEVRLQHN